ncbi:biliverdin-producing heme oxygenase [Devosia submarina]|uniref:biliverdin-producing heme oxygenase n=1 Tax=Devosia submarina TaxID=1173082 RepID=UPI00130077B3|nr:biliverdin-producing heme oxygenase [Devosia submarina]
MTQPNIASSLTRRLRVETAEAHARLEAATGFDLHRPSAASAIAMLENFHRVLTVFEPAMLALLPARLQERSRLALLEADLTKLGRAPERRSFAPLWLPHHKAEAFGALYVMEGSTLGGKLISRALQKTADWPLKSPNYFDPYGPQTGAMWSLFQDELLDIPPADANGVIHGANETFTMLESAFAREAVS